MNNIVERVLHQKQLGIILDNKLDFKQLIDNTISKVNKGISMIRKLRHSLSLKSLVTIYKVFYGHQLTMEISSMTKKKKESVQCKAALAITGAIQGFFQDEVYQELGLETLDGANLEDATNVSAVCLK